MKMFNVRVFLIFVVSVGLFAVASHASVDQRVYFTILHTPTAIVHDVNVKLIDFDKKCVTPQGKGFLIHGVCESKVIAKYELGGYFNYPGFPSIYLTRILEFTADGKVTKGSGNLEFFIQPNQEGYTFTITS